MKDMLMKAIRFGAFLLAVSAACGAWAQSPKKKIAVIVNAANPVDSLRNHHIRELILKKTPTWRSALADVTDKKGFDDGESVRPVDLATGNEERRVFLDKVLEMTSASLERHWVKVQYQNAIDPPVVAESSDRMIRLVGS